MPGLGVRRENGARRAAGREKRAGSSSTAKRLLMRVCSGCLPDMLYYCNSNMLDRYIMPHYRYIMPHYRYIMPHYRL